MQFPTPIPFAEHLGLNLLSMGEGCARLRLLISPSLGNSFGVAHGGAIMSGLDIAMAHAARSGHPPPDFAPGVVTIEMKASFLRPLEGVIDIEGRLLHRTATMCFCEGTVSNAAGAICATSSGTFKYLRALPVGGQRTNVLRTTGH